MRRYGAAFTAETELFYNNSGTAISQGHLVSWSGTVSNVEDPIPEPATGKRPMLANQATRSSAPTRKVMGIKRAAASDQVNHPCGVALDDIANTAWGLCMVGAGPVDVRIGISSNIAAGDYLKGTAEGLWIEDATSASALTMIYGIALEATITSGTCNAALISALVSLPLGGGMGKAAP